MRLLKKKTNFDFMGPAHFLGMISIILLIGTVVLLSTRGLNYGLDFTGGTLIEVGYPSAPEIADVRANLEAAGISNSVVQTFGTASEVIVRIPPTPGDEDSAQISTTVLNALQQGVEGEVIMRRVEFVGPQVGDDLTEQGILAVVYALIGIFIYLMFRFQWRFSIGAVAATVHDVLLCMGIISLFQIEFDLTAVAAILAVIGYSVNDTVVLYDRIRENFPKLRKSLPTEVINTSINQVLARTLMMSLTTAVTMVALYIFGGSILHTFSFIMILGVVIGTYSSIYVASAALLYLGVSKYDLLQVEKEGVGEVDARP
jgi:preprotein translocase subunit SecF